MNPPRLSPSVADLLSRLEGEPCGCTRRGAAAWPSRRHSRRAPPAPRASSPIH